ncbi:hypothetical protein BTUL_0235g00040 [Botrytis tulipae]|uniref:Uncharacterized protein n=1 Tax=Botrytis tulipae TaxID=87230 RepID=A0A4Z1EEV9_9HELO|nr:hypothetical protein BTUL_0235g00040 [Botrytis tulipae]
MGEEKKRDKKRDTRPLPTVYENGHERRHEREQSIRRSETGTSSHYHSSHASSRRTQDPPGGSTARRLESQKGPPLSKSALHSYEDPNTAKSEVASIASISSRGHKSATVVGQEVARKDRRSNRNDWAQSEEDVIRARATMEQRQGSLSETERSKKTSDFADKMTELVPEARLAAAAADLARSKAASAKGHASRETQDPQYTRESREGRHHTRSRSEATSSRRSQSTAPRERTSSRTHDSRTKIAITGNANLTIHDHDQGTTTHIISRSSGRQHHAPRPPSLSSHSGDTTTYRPAPALPPQLLNGPRIQELGSVAASSYGSSSYDSEITARPLRTGSGSTRSSSFEHYDADVRTVNTSEAARIMGGPSVSRGAYLEPTSSFYKTEIRRPSWAASSVAGSSSRPAPPLSNYPLSVRSRGDSQYSSSRR